MIQKTAQAHQMTEQMRSASRPVLPDDTLRGRVGRLVTHRVFDLTVSLVIGLNSIFIGFETDLSRSQNADDFKTIFQIVEASFFIFYLFELGLRFFWARLQFFRDGWNIFDSLLVALGLTDFLLEHLSLIEGDQLDILVALRFLRLAKLARIFRLVKFFKELWLLLEGLLETFRTTLVWAWLLIALIIYWYANLATRILGQPHKELEKDFGDVLQSMLTFFEVMSTEGWSDVARESMELEPWSWVLFATFLCFTTYAVMHVVVAVVVNKTMNRAGERKDELAKKTANAERRAYEKLGEVFCLADDDGNGELTKEEFLSSLEKSEVIRYMQEVHIDVRSAESLFSILDFDESGSVEFDEFVEGMLNARGEAKAKDVLAVQCDIWKAEVRGVKAVSSLKQATCDGLQHFDESLRLFTEELLSLVPEPPRSAQSRARGLPQ